MKALQHSFIVHWLWLHDILNSKVSGIDALNMLCHTLMDKFILKLYNASLFQLDPVVSNKIQMYNEYVKNNNMVLLCKSYLSASQQSLVISMTET
jgi:hypothetical protein